MSDKTGKLASTGYFTVEIVDPQVTVQQIAAPGITGYVLGRSDPRSSYRPDIDLADFKALELGVSRRHAALVNHEDSVYILDLDSVNGTFLNGERLQPDKPYPLYQDTELRLGSLNLLLRKVK
jgi:pSer/pThr/pTyr-binding forkhead associated (FHA) protein